MTSTPVHPFFYLRTAARTTLSRRTWMTVLVCGAYIAAAAYAPLLTIAGAALLTAAQIWRSAVRLSKAHRVIEQTAPQVPTALSVLVDYFAGIRHVTVDDVYAGGPHGLRLRAGSQAVPATVRSGSTPSSTSR